jgi:hypothetical protein
MARISRPKWFENCGGWFPRLILPELRAGIAAGFLNDQDESGMTALHLAVASGWEQGVAELLRAGADTELRHFRTGATALYTAVQQKNKVIIEALLAAGANPDAGNYWGVTPRIFSRSWFAGIRSRKIEMPAPVIQNAEHLAEHYHPHFKIPDRTERETLQAGQAVLLYVFGPKGKSHDTVKVRISTRRGERPKVRYRGVVETPLKQTHLPEGTKELEFGPENVATVFVAREKKKAVKTSRNRSDAKRRYDLRGSPCAGPN